MFGSRSLRIAAVAAAVALPLGLVASTSVSAAPAKPKTASVSVLHGIPGLTVDVCAGDKVLIPGFTPGTLAGPLALPPATYALGLQAAVPGIAAGAACAGPYALSASVAVKAGKSYTITANLKPAVGADGKATAVPALNVFMNNQSQLPKNKGRLTVRHIAAAPAVDVFANGNVIMSNLSNGQQQQRVVPKGTYQAAAGLAGAGTAGIALGPVPVTIKSGVNTIVYAWGAPTSAGGTGIQVAVQEVKSAAK